VKIDKSIVHARAAGRPSIMRDLVELAHANGLRVVAEGIETAEQLVESRDLGCDRAQGFLLGRPAPEAEITQMLAVAGHQS